MCPNIRKTMNRIFALFVLFLFLGASTADAQWNSYNPFQTHNNLLVNNAIGNAIVCDSFRKAGKRLPAECANRSSQTNGSRSGTTGSTAAQRPLAVTGKFTPTAGAESFEMIAANISDDPSEKQLLVQVANAMNSTIEQEYGAKGWKNNVAGAVTFFVASMLTVYYDKEPSAAVQDAIFDSFNTAPEFAAASNKDKQGLYNSLIVFSGMPLVFYIDGKRKGDDDQVQKAKALAKHNFKTLLKAEPELLRDLMSINVSTIESSDTTAPQNGNVTAALGPIDAEYSCVKLTSKNGNAVYEPAGLSFTIAGSSYSVVSGTGGRVKVSGGITQFSGGRLNGWRGEMRSNSTGSYLFFRVNFTDVRPGESVKFGDIQCYQQ